MTNGKVLAGTALLKVTTGKKPLVKQNGLHAVTATCTDVFFGHTATSNASRKFYEQKIGYGHERNNGLGMVEP